MKLKMKEQKKKQQQAKIHPFLFDVVPNVIGLTHLWP